MIILFNFYMPICSFNHIINKRGGIIMADNKKKTGLFGLIKESLKQTGCGCGPGGCGSSCEPSKKESEEEKRKDQKK